MKLERFYQPPTKTIDHKFVIDLTGDDVPVRHAQAPIRASNQASHNSIALPLRGAGRRPPSRDPNTQPIVIYTDTSSILARCASKLRAAANGMAADRESLRERWEVDIKLQLQTVTDDLAELNSRFGDAEQAVFSAIDIIEQRLLRR